MRTAAFAALAAVCALSGTAAAQDKVWKHGLINAKSDAGIFMMVSTRDFAAKQGLKLEISQFKDDQLALKAMIAGELDSFEGGPQGVFAADSKGADAKILGCHWIVVPHGIYATDAVKTVADLKGKQIAVSDADVKLAAVGGDRERFQALIGGVVEAAVVSNEYEPVAPKNIHLLIAGRDAVPNFLRVCIVSTAKTLAARGDDAVRFLAAEMNALRFALSHRDETIALTHEISQAKADDPRPSFVFDDAIKYQAVDPTLPLPAEKIQWIQDQ